MPVAVLAAKRAANTGREVIVATSANPSDDELATLIQKAGLRGFRGSLEDTLDRVVNALSGLDDRTVVFRLTADNVFPDGPLLDQMEEEFLKGNLEYLCCNGKPSGLPFGMSVEVTRLGHLRDAARESVFPYDREHVTPYVVRKFGQTFFQRYKDLDKGHLRCTIDYPEDYLRVQQVFSGIADPVHVSALELISRLAEISGPVVDGLTPRQG